MAKFSKQGGGTWDAITLPTGSLATTASQDGEDLHAYTRYFYGRGGGTFLEMGALDGVLYSNTLALEVEAGWHGVHIEASPSSFDALARNRPGQVAVHAAVCGSPRRVHFIDGPVPAVRAIVEMMPPGFMRQWHPALAAEMAAVSLDDVMRGLPEVTCAPLADILAAVGDITHINFFVLDVEGAELEVLQALDLTRVSFDVVVVEAYGALPANDQVRLPPPPPPPHPFTRGLWRYWDWCHRTVWGGGAHPRPSRLTAQSRRSGSATGAPAAPLVRLTD